MARIPAHVTLRALRIQRGLDSRELAEVLGRDHGVKVDPDHILAVELGHRGAGVALRNAWAAWLGINAVDIHTGPELQAIAAADASGEKREDGAAA